MKTVKEIPNFLLDPSSSARLVLLLGLRYCYGFERCHELWSMRGDQRVSERERASVSLGPDPQASISRLLGLTGLQYCIWPLQVGGRCSHTVQAVFKAFLSPHPDAGDCEHAGGAGSVFFRPDGRCQCDSLCSPFDDRLSCVSWIPPDPLVELYHWLQGEGTGGLVTSR